MPLPFLNRTQELRRLEQALNRREDTLTVVYGRRRLGKSRLIREALAGRVAVSYFGDERDAQLQRESLAQEIAAVVPGFADVDYPDWDSLLKRFWLEAPAGCVLALDEFPMLVLKSPELPSLLQKRLEPHGTRFKHLVLSGSSQTMMQGLVLDAAAPLYGRAREILKIEPMTVGWLQAALGTRSDEEAVTQWAAWGGVPRYWELARDSGTLEQALEQHVLDPLGVLHQEPERLLLDDLAEVTRAASLLALVGRGVHRVTEMAGRLAVPATSLSRPLARLTELGFLQRETPFGRLPKDSKQTNYRIADPFLRTWYRFVDPNRSRLGAGRVQQVIREVTRDWPQHLGQAWEDLARASTAWLRIGGAGWEPGARWWGRGNDGSEIEIDVLARDGSDPDHILVGEARVRGNKRDTERLLHELRGKASQCPLLAGRRLTFALWLLVGPAAASGVTVVTARDVVRASRPSAARRSTRR